MAKDFLIKIHKSYRWVVAICDKELYGQKLEADDMQLDLSGKFFEGKEVEKTELVETIEMCTYEDATFYIIGHKSIKCAKEIGLIEKGGIKEIAGIPFALVLL